jgi:hypothetical protein
VLRDRAALADVVRHARSGPRADLARLSHSGPCHAAGRLWAGAAQPVAAPSKALGLTALIVALGATILGGASVQPREAHDWGIFFGVDFFALNLIAGVMFAPLERILPHRAKQRLFRPEWSEDLFYFLVSSMLVQLITFLALAPSSYLNAHGTALGSIRATISGLPWQCSSCWPCSSPI